MAEAYAAEHGLTLDDSLRDLGLSAYSGAHRTRGALGHFLAAIERGEVPRGSMLIVESLDRLSREDVLAALEQMTALIRAGISIVTLSDRQHYSRESIQADWTRLLISLTIMSRAHEESERKSELVGAAWAAKRARAADGEAMTGRCVAWCRAEGKGAMRRYVLIPERAAIVQRIFEEAAGGIGQWQIAGRLNRDGVPTWGRGAGWHASYVLKILSNRACLGFGQPHRKVGGKRTADGPEVPGYYPPAVSEALYWRAQAARGERRVGGGGRKGHGVANLFSRLARCASCGAAMVHVDKGPKPKGGRYLVCDSLRRGRECASPAGWWRYDRAEEAILRGLRRMDVAAVLGHPDPAADTAAKAASLRDALAAAERRRDRFIDALGDVDDPAIVARVRAAADDVKRLRSESAAADEEAAKATHTRADLPDRLDLIDALAVRMRTAEGDDLHALRSRLAQEIARTVRRLDFSPRQITAHYVAPHISRLTPRGWGVPLIIHDGHEAPGDDANAYAMAQHGRERKRTIGTQKA